jgi:prepilin-type N-terminal cleavage/methylation domain-containing protein
MDIKNKFYKEKAFSMIESLIVIGIVAIFAAAIIISVNASISRAKDEKRKENIHQLVVAFNSIAGSTGSLPSVGGKSVCIGFGSSASCAGGLISGSDSLQTQLKKVISPIIPLDPSPSRAWNTYVYTDASVCPGCQTTCVSGNYILWNPENGTKSNADCQGVGVYACCSPGLCGGDNGNFCALKIN